MITLLHGDHVDASRNELSRIRSEFRGAEIRSFDGSVSDEQLVQGLDSTSLFGADHLVIIQRMFSKLTRQQKRIAAVCGIIRAHASGDVVIWEDREMTKTVIKELGSGVRNQLFKLPPSVFQFLDSIRPGHAAQNVALFTRALESNAPEIIFSLLVGRIRQLIQIVDSNNPDGLAPWQIQRLTSQSKYFTIDQLTRVHTQLFETEVEIKSGLSSLPLKARIPQILISL